MSVTVLTPDFEFSVCVIVLLSSVLCVLDVEVVSSLLLFSPLFVSVPDFVFSTLYLRVSVVTVSLEPVCQF